METAFVKIWDTVVAAIVWDKAAGFARFEYDSKFKELNWELAPLTMPINSSRKEFSFPELRKGKNAIYDTFKGLPGLLADALPDNYGNQLMNIWLAQQGRPQNSLNPVEMLCFIGKRGMGALEFEPSTIKENIRTFSVELDSLVNIAQRMLATKETFHTNLQREDENALMEILKIGTSAGGARPKAVIAYNEKTGEVKSGQTRVPQGFEHWLIKLDGVSAVQLGESNGFGRVEMAYYHMARGCGIDMMTSKLIEENGRAHFMTKRFDREGADIKHHIQTFCGMKHFDFNLVNSFSYEQLFQTMRELKLDYPDAEQMFRRMVFNVIARNCDDHTKNFSFRMKRDQNWELAPAYDICHAYRPDSEWVSQHALSIKGKRKNILKSDLLEIGKSIKCKNAAQIIQDINHEISRWKFYADEVGVKSTIKNEIASTLLNIT